METHEDLLSMVINSSSLIGTGVTNILTTTGSNTSTTTFSPNTFQLIDVSQPISSPGLNGYINYETLISDAIAFKDLQIKSREGIIKALDASIELLTEKTNNEYEDQALKHLTYAKAFLEKSLLEKIKEKTDGNSKPD